MSALLNRLEKAERVSGIGAPCEACELRADYDARLGEFNRARGIPSPSRASRIRLSCDWCGRRVIYPAGGFTTVEVAAFEELDALYWRGDMCLPDYKRLRGLIRAAGKRELAAHYGEHFREMRQLLAEYMKAIRGIREMQPGGAYLCRVPGCVCKYPKTFEEWRANVEENGYRISGLNAAAKRVLRR